MEEYIKEIERIAVKCTESQSDGYSQIMRICDAIFDECLLKSGQKKTVNKSNIKAGRKI